MYIPLLWSHHLGLNSLSQCDTGVIPLVLLFSCQVMSNSFATPWTVACQAPLSVGRPLVLLLFLDTDGRIAMTFKNYC